MFFNGRYASLAGVAALLLSLASAFGAPLEKRPNLLFILTDDQNGDGFSAALHPLPVLKTPNLDVLARQGVVFDNCYAETPICACSRASILTGQYLRTHGIRDFATPLSPAQLAETYPALLKKSGYFTGFLGKFGVGSLYDRDLLPPSRYFDDWHVFKDQGVYFPPDDPLKRHINEIQLDQATQFLEQAARQSKPFALSISMKAPHDPWNEYEPKYHDFYRTPIPPPSTLTPRDFLELPDFVRNGLSGLRNKEVRESAFKTPPDLRPYEESVGDYYRQIQGIDDFVAHVRRQLDRLGLASNTIIIFTSDNGHFVYEHGLYGKWNFYEPSAHIPLIIDDPRPGQMSPGRRAQFALLVDIAPTLLDYAGVPVPAGMQGESLRPLVGETIAPDWRQSFFLEHTFTLFDGLIPRSVGVRQGPWKYIRWIEQRPRYESLFNLDADPLEQHDLAEFPAYQARLQELRALCDGYRMKIKDNSPDYYEYPEYTVISTGYKSSEQELDFAPARTLGQTFIATGRELKQIETRISCPASVLAPCGIRVRLFQDGPKGKLLAEHLIPAGDIRFTEANKINFDLPTTAGEKLFIQFQPEKPIGTHQLGYFAYLNNTYSPGTAWIDGVAQAFDLEMQFVFR